MLFDRVGKWRRAAAALVLAGNSLVLAKALPDEDCDVAVVGAGTAGVAAALQSARAGARTIVVEQGFQVGGTMTSGGVNFPGLFHAWGRQVIDGVGYALVTNCVALSGGKLPDFGEPVGTAHWKHQISVNVPLYVALAEEALLKAGARLHYHAAPTKVAFSNGVWSLSVAAVGDTRTIRARQVIDCTGNASVAAMAGFARERADARQPGTFVYTVDPGTDVDRLDRTDLERRFSEALSDGRLRPNDTRWGMFNFLKCRGGTANYVDDADSSTADLRTETNMRGRASMLRMYRFLRSVPGLEKTTLVSMSPEVGVRETYRVVGEKTLTEADYLAGTVEPDSLCYSYWYIDEHNAAWKNSHMVFHEPGKVGTIPLGTMIPKGVQHLLVAGRAVSSDHGANSALRVQASCMAIGQSAGVVAALAAQRGIDPRAVPIDDAKRQLKAIGAIVP